MFELLKNFLENSRSGLLGKMVGIKTRGAENYLGLLFLV
jgi:hypothetical protein